jgi:hypothetical protein
MKPLLLALIKKADEHPWFVIFLIILAVIIGSILVPKGTGWDFFVVALICSVIIGVVSWKPNYKTNKVMPLICWLVVLPFPIIYANSENKINDYDYKLVYDLDTGNFFGFSIKPQQTIKNRIICFVPFVRPVKDKYSDFKYIGKLICENRTNHINGKLTYEKTCEWKEVVEDTSPYGANILVEFAEFKGKNTGFCNRFAEYDKCMKYPFDSVFMRIDSVEYTEDMVEVLTNIDIEMDSILSDLHSSIDSIYKAKGYKKPNRIKETLFKDIVIKNGVSIKYWFYKEHIEPYVKGYQPEMFDD